MRIAHWTLAVAVLALMACGEEPEKRELIPTGPSKPAAVIVKPLPAIDLSKASSICRASVKAHEAASQRLLLVPSDGLALQKAATLNAIVNDACK